MDQYNMNKDGEYNVNAGCTFKMITREDIT